MTGEPAGAESGEAGQHDRAERLEIYKMYVEMTDRSSGRRLSTNSFFVTLNSASAGWLAFLTSKTDHPRAGLIATAVLGVILAVAWWLSLKTFHRLSAAKFDVIGQLEQSLPAAPFTREWEKFTGSTSTTAPDAASAGAWQKLLTSTSIEQTVPVAFGVFFIVVAVVAW